MDKVIFIQAFANKKAGESFVCDRGLASQLVHHDNVAVYEKDFDKKLIKKQPHETAVQYDEFVKSEQEDTKQVEVQEEEIQEETEKEA